MQSTYTDNLVRRWVRLLEMIDEALKLKRAGSKWATLPVDGASEVLGVSKTQVNRFRVGRCWSASARGAIYDFSLILRLRSRLRWGLKPSVTYVCSKRTLRRTQPK